MKTLTFRLRFSVILVLLLPPFVRSARAADTAALIGTVNNLATGNLLEGARVEIPALGVSALTD